MFCNYNQPRIRQTTKLFAAIDLPEQLKDEVNQIAEALKLAYPFKAWNTPIQFHITLKSFGNCDEAQKETIKRQLQGISSRNSPFFLTLGRLGTFNEGSPRPDELWLGVREASAAKLYTLQNDINMNVPACETMGTLGKYHAHISFAFGYAGPSDFDYLLLDKLNDALRSKFLNPSLWVTHFHLYQSTGERDESIATFPLRVRTPGGRRPIQLGGPASARTYWC